MRMVTSVQVSTRFPHILFIEYSFSAHIDIALKRPISADKKKIGQALIRMRVPETQNLGSFKKHNWNVGRKKNEFFISMTKF